MAPLSVFVILLWSLLPLATVAENIEYHGGPIPVNFEPGTVGQRILQIEGTPASVDMSGLFFALQGGPQQQDTGAMTIHILLVRKKRNDSDDRYRWSLSPDDIEGVLNPFYCDANNDDDDPSPIIHSSHPRLALHYSVELQPDGTNARLFPETADAWSAAPVTQTGPYVLILTTCKANNRAYADGFVRIRSSYGRLPGEQVPIALFMVLLSLFTTVLAGRYGLRLYCTSRSGGSHTSTTGTTTERVVLWALTSMALQAVVLVVYFGLWNHTGDRPSYVIYAIMMLEVAKHALTFGVAFMMSMGQGYSVAVVVLGVWYLVLSFVIEVLRFVLQEYGATVNSLLWSKVLSVLNVGYYVTDILVILLVLCFLSRTMRYLKRANQLTKLRRYRAFLALLLLILLATVVAVFGTEMRFYGVVVSECSFVAVLTAISCLWWPHPENQDYERVMQLPQLDPDGNVIIDDQEDEFDDGLNDEFGGVELNTKEQEDMFTESETDYGEEL